MSSDRIAATALLFFLFSAASTAATTEAAPGFSDYPVAKIYRGKPAPAQVLSSSAHRFRTVIREGAESGPNFAGHYTVVVWGCGTSCAQFVIVDAVSGKVYDPPFKSIVGGDAKGSLKEWGLHFQVDSELFLAQGCPEERNCAARYYRWNGQALVLLTTRPVERFPEPPYEPPTITVKASSQPSFQLLSNSTFVSPDKGSTAFVAAAGKEKAYEEAESRVEIRDSNGTVLCAYNFSSPDGEHGYAVDAAQWTPDSEFFVLRLRNSGGHMPMYAPVAFWSRSENHFRQLIDFTADQVFLVIPPDKISMETWPNVKPATIALHDQDSLTTIQLR